MRDASVLFARRLAPTAVALLLFADWWLIRTTRMILAIIVDDGVPI